MSKERIKNGLMLFAFFFKIGCFTFGGGQVIPSTAQTPPNQPPT